MTSPDRLDAASDDGLALPRTSLAWRRTSLAFLVAALVSFRVALGCTDKVMVATAAVVVVALASAVVGITKTRSGGHAFGLPRDGRALLATSALIVVLAVIELTTTLTQCD